MNSKEGVVKTVSRLIITTALMAACDRVPPSIASPFISIDDIGVNSLAARQEKPNLPLTPIRDLASNPSKYADQNILVQGHFSCVGIRSYNPVLGEDGSIRFQLYNKIDRQTFPPSLMSFAYFKVNSSTDQTDNIYISTAGLEANLSRSCQKDTISQDLLWATGQMKKDSDGKYVLEVTDLGKIDSSKSNTP